MKTYVLYSIVSADTKRSENYILSTDKKEILFPIVDIVQPRSLWNEIRYNAKKMFDEESIKFAQEIIVSYSEIQNEFVLDYIESLNNDSLSIDTDIFILCGIIMSKKDTKSHFWQKIEMSLDKLQRNATYSIIDYTLQKSLV